MQGLGTAPITLFGTPAQRARYLPRVRARRRAIAAFALTEPEAGSDVAAIADRRAPDDDGWRLDGDKTWISNGGIADHYVVFARTDAGARAARKGISAFVVDADTPGLAIAERIEMIAPHPLATLALRRCRVADDALLGEPGDGFKLAMATLDVFRADRRRGGARLRAARARRGAGRARSRRLFGAPLADLQLTQATLADMATAIDARALLVYRAAWAARRRAPRASPARRRWPSSTRPRRRSASSTRRCSSSAARGVRRGSAVEELYREIRALRIYEGASEVQKIIIARQEIGR